MKKILHMTPPDVNNGIYRYIFNHMPYISQQEYQFAFLTKAAGDLRRTREYSRYHFPIYCLHNTERENKEALEKEVRTILMDGFDILHLHTSSWRGFLIEEIAMDMGIGKVIVHSHSAGIDEMSSSERQKRIQAHEQYKERFSMKFATDVCACSWKAADWLFGSQIDRGKIKILPNAIEADKYAFNKIKREKMRIELGIEDKIVIGCVGRYCYQKNQEFLMEAFEKACRRNRNLFLLCIGQGQNIAGIRQKASVLGIAENSLYLDWQTNIEDYLQAMDIFCFPSRFEGLGIAAIEAQAAGLRCLVSDTITREVALTDRVTFLPLEEEIWQRELENAVIDSSRKAYDKELAERGYDLRSAAVKLTDLYDRKTK